MESVSRIRKLREHISKGQDEDMDEYVQNIMESEKQDEPRKRFSSLTDEVIYLREEKKRLETTNIAVNKRVEEYGITIDRLQNKLDSYEKKIREFIKLTVYPEKIHLMDMSTIGSEEDEDLFHLLDQLRIIIFNTYAEFKDVIEEQDRKLRQRQENIDDIRSLPYHLQLESLLSSPPEGEDHFSEYAEDEACDEETIYDEIYGAERQEQKNREVPDDGDTPDKVEHKEKVEKEERVGHEDNMSLTYNNSGVPEENEDKPEGQKRSPANNDSDITDKLSSSIIRNTGKIIEWCKQNDYRYKITEGFNLVVDKDGEQLHILVISPSFKYPSRQHKDQRLEKCLSAGEKTWYIVAPPGQQEQAFDMWVVHWRKNRPRQLLGINAVTMSIDDFLKEQYSEPMGL